MITSVVAQLRSPFVNITDLLTAEGKKSHQKATTGSPDKEFFYGKSKDTIKFVECIESHSEDLGLNPAGKKMAKKPQYAQNYWKIKI